ncbi:MAG: hypothetical protein KVP17_002870 [Porospora cf. gigantea B]|uniref:uncharacterized protein n=1 Tax=Porospora cf. gigantea B TaxID=2853592 RepID=UPI003571BA78|nr:MAG: hypothetical protein KVP17_002870 [Porospora cf. gigantea B]
MSNAQLFQYYNTNYTGTSAATETKARLQCHECQRLLEYDAGAQYVSCFGCNKMNAVEANNPIGGKVIAGVCFGCNTTNLLPHGVLFMRCGSCHEINNLKHGYKDGFKEDNFKEDTFKEPTLEEEG